MPQYWALRAFTKFGTIIAMTAAVLPIVVTVLCIMPVSWNWALFAASMVAGGAAGFFVKVFSELAQVIVDMLLPVQT